MITSKVILYRYVLNPPHFLSITFKSFSGLDANANIEDKYSDLLNTLAEMRSELAPTIMGLRAPKDRLHRDIAQARYTVRECLLLLEKDCQQESEGSPTGE